MPSGFVTVPSVYARNYGFTVTGTNTLAYAVSFAHAIDAAIDQATLAYSNLSNPTYTVPTYTSSTEPTLVEQEISTTGSYLLSSDSVSGPIYTFVSANGPDSVTGSGLGDTLLVAGINSATDYLDEGGNNQIIFVDGNNVYDGNSQLGTDTIVAGSGFDTVTTGEGKALVYSGTGDGTITLNDTLAAGATTDVKSVTPSDYNQFVYLDDGHNTVFANGIADVIVSTAPGQVVVGGIAGDTDLVVLVPPGADSTVPGSTNATASLPDSHDTIVASGAHFSVWNGTDNNAIFGGSGALTAVFADGVEGSVVAGTGSNVVWGNSGDTINYFSATSSSGGIIVMGGGAESVNASGAFAPLTIVIGTGNETLTGGTSSIFNANFAAADGSSNNVTIHGFGGGDLFNFVNYTQDQYATALQSGTQTADGYQLTLSDNSTVTFIGISSLNGHTERT